MGGQDDYSGIRKSRFDTRSANVRYFGWMSTRPSPSPSAHYSRGFCCREVSLHELSVTGPDVEHGASKPEALGEKRRCFPACVAVSVCGTGMVFCAHLLRRILPADSDSRDDHPEDARQKCKCSYADGNHGCGAHGLHSSITSIPPNPVSRAPMENHRDCSRTKSKSTTWFWSFKDKTDINCKVEMIASAIHASSSIS